MPCAVWPAIPRELVVASGTILLIGIFNEYAMSVEFRKKVVDVFGSWIRLNPSALC